MSRCKLEEFISYEQPTKYIVDSDQYDDSYEIPVLTAGKSFILGYTDEKNNIFDDLPVIIFDDFTTSLQFVDFPFKVKSSAMKLLKNTEQADVKYCYYLLKFLQHTPENHKRQWLSATSQNTVELPTIEEQKNIVKKLDKILEVIDNQNKQLELLDEAIKARFVEMFGDMESNTYGFEIKPFSELVEYMGDIGSNGANSVVTEHLDMKNTEDYALMVRFLNFTKNDFYNDVKYISKDAYEFFKKSQLFGGELIMCKIGSAGLNYVMPYLNRPVSLGLNQIMIRINDKTLMPYLYQYLHSDYGEFLISGCINGAVTKSITKTELKKIPVIVPPMELQSQFADFVKEVDKSKFFSNHSLFLLKSITF